MTGFFAVTPGLVLYPSTNTFYPIFNNTNVVGGYNDGVLNTTTGVATVPYNAPYSIDASINFEYNGSPSTYYIELSIEVDGNETRIKRQDNVVSNDANTFDISGTLFLQAGQTVRVKMWVNKTAPGQQIINGFLGSYFSMAALE